MLSWKADGELYLIFYKQKQNLHFLHVYKLRNNNNSVVNVSKIWIIPHEIFIRTYYE